MNSCHFTRLLLLEEFDRLVNDLAAQDSCTAPNGPETDATPETDDIPEESPPTESFYPSVNTKQAITCSV